MTDKQVKAKDARLRKKFGITFEDHEGMRAAQGNKCAICGELLDRFGPPSVDHYHFKISAFRAVDSETNEPKGWCAVTLNEGGEIQDIYTAPTKKEALAEVKKKTMPWSVRGLLDLKCNRAIGCVEKLLGATTNPDILLKVADYLRARLFKTNSSIDEGDFHDQI